METGPVDLRKRCCHRNRSLRRLLGGGGGVTPASRRPSEEFRARRRRRKFVITCARIQVTTGAPPPLYPPPPLLPLTCTHRRNFCQSANPEGTWRKELIRYERNSERTLCHRCSPVSIFCDGVTILRLDGVTDDIVKEGRDSGKSYAMTSEAPDCFLSHVTLILTSQEGTVLNRLLRRGFSLSRSRTFIKTCVSASQFYLTFICHSFCITSTTIKAECFMLRFCFN